MGIKLVPAAKKWHKRWTTWLLAVAAVLSSLQAFMPGIQQYMTPEAYSGTMIALAVITWAAAQIKQGGMPGGDK